MRNIEDYAKKYLEAGFEDYQVKYRRKKVMEILEKHQPERVLEIGCGMEPMFSYANWEYHLWTVVEPCGLFCENAKTTARSMGRDERVLIYDEEFPTTAIAESNFDFILCSGLLHEVENEADFLRGIASACSRDTVVHVNVPNANSMHRVIARAGGVIEDVHDFSERNARLQQNRVFDMELLKTTLKNAGFSACDCGSYFVKPFTHGQMYEMVKGGVIGEKVLDGLYAISGMFQEYGSEIYVNAKLKSQEQYDHTFFYSRQNT